MALKKTYNFKGVEIVDAYHRISFMTGYKNGDDFIVTIDVEISKEKGSEVIDSFVKRYSFVYDLLSEENAIIQGYNQMKLHPEYIGAQDV